jgi:hypothetical protein
MQDVLRAAEEAMAENGGTAASTRITGQICTDIDTPPIV